MAGEVLVKQAWGPEFDLQPPHKGQGLRCVFVVAATLGVDVGVALGVQRQGESWDSLISWSG